MDKYICECCGGHINPVTMKCEYCDTQYKSDGGYNSPLEIYPVPVRGVRCSTSISDEAIMAMGPEEASKYIMHRIANKLSESIMPYISYCCESDPMCHQQRVTAFVKVAEPTGHDQLTENLNRMFG